VAHLARSYRNDNPEIEHIKNTNAASDPAVPIPPPPSMRSPLRSGGARFGGATDPRDRRRGSVHLLTALPDGGPFERFLPEPPDRAPGPASSLPTLNRRSRGDVALAQEEDFQTIQVSASGGQTLSSAA
jgi:hypothetical protein